MTNFKNGMRPIHPGEILLQDYLRPAGTSVRAAAKVLDVPYRRLLQITRGERPVTAELAEKLERHFGAEGQGWLNLQAAFHRARYPMPAPTWEDVSEELLRELRARLGAADMISVDDVARLLKVKSVVVDTLVRTRRVLAVRLPGEPWRFPAWQFVEPLQSLLPSILDGLGYGDWGALAWLDRPLGGLSGRTPRTAVEQGDGARVVAMAGAECN